MGEHATPPDDAGLPTLAESDGQIFPPERVSYTPPREGQQQAPQPPAPQPAAQQPPPEQQPAGNPPPPAPAPAGDAKPLQPLFIAELPRPRAAASDASGNIYIFAEGDSRVHKLDPQGKELAAWDVKNKDGAPLIEGSAIAVLGEQVLVLDAATSEAYRFGLDGAPQGSVTLCTCFFPRAMSPATDGSLWIADTGNNKVLKVTSQGAQQASKGEKGSGSGQLFEPAGVWQAPDGTVYVVDTSNGRMQSFGSDLVPLKSWPIGPLPGTRPAMRWSPRVTVAPS
jgi:sugar lactone lactonase YvrE